MTMAETLVVIRAGATDYEMQGRIRGTLDVPLCEQGIEEAEQIARQLADVLPNVLATSGYIAARETARIVGRHLGLESKPLAGLANLDLGLWQGSRADDIRCRQPRLHRQWQCNPWTVAPPEGETLDAACRRVETVIERLLRRTFARSVALVLPDPLDRVVRWMAMGQPVGDLWRRDSREPAVLTVPLAGQWRQVVRQPQPMTPVG